MTIEPGCCIQDFDRSAIACSWKKRVRLWSQPIDHFRTSNRLRTAPSVNVPLPLEFLAMLLYSHVAEFQPTAKFVDRKSLSFLKRVNYAHPLRAANFTYSLHRISIYENGWPDLNRTSRTLITQLGGFSVTYRLSRSNRSLPPCDPARATGSACLSARPMPSEMTPCW